MFKYILKQFYPFNPHKFKGFSYIFMALQYICSLYDQKNNMYSFRLLLGERMDRTT